MVSVSGITANDGDIGLTLKDDTKYNNKWWKSIDKTFATPINEIFTLDKTVPSVTIIPDRTIYTETLHFKANIVFK